ncbi:hypothetical protein [Streptomyces sporangiiformans]|uniref:Squalene cyclase C-terminal domain-containing protein n=1 Tax=Streptomyces sporangiiformans TaxID=2315329 RepID=A0A505DRJ0_9ACTN|nr:hypothetical protein [Streptomyces sporangiiformans]TPQ23840.1 hypothetical protein FGD71_001795 [Streptomyces sporangiiformans]
MSQQQLGRGPLRTDADSEPPPPSGPRPARFVRWLGGFGCAAAGYAVFQSLVGVLPDSIEGESARYAIAAVSGLGTALAAWLAAALVRSRSGENTPVGTGRVVAAAPPLSGPGPFPELFSATYAALAEHVSVVDDPDAGRLTGWPHSLGESAQSRPTPVGTAYGLHSTLDLGVPDGRLSTGDLVETLWRLRLPDGGWSARSQGTVARPEVTALVLGALARAGADPARLASEVSHCASGFTLELDPTGRELTHVVTTVLRGLLRAAPHADVLPLLRDSLVDGAITDPRRQHRRCWGYRLAPVHGQPSPLHTALAVLALDRAARVLGESGNARAAREDGIRWLLACPDAPHHSCLDLSNLREEVRRPRPDDPSRHEVLNVRHFTASWVVRALLTPGARDIAREDGLEEEWREQVNGAATAVWAAQTDGVWTWVRDDTGELRRPMWMTYQGLSALRAHAVWMYQPPG